MTSQVVPVASGGAHAADTVQIRAAGRHLETWALTVANAATCGPIEGAAPEVEAAAADLGTSWAGSLDRWRRDLTSFGQATQLSGRMIDEQEAASAATWSSALGGVLP